MKGKSRTSAQNYSEEFKRKVIEEYLKGYLSKVDLLRKYDIKFRSAIQTWMKKLDYIDPYVKTEYVSSEIPILPVKKKKLLKDTPESLSQRIKELETKLVDEQLRSEAYLKIIEIAERDLKINIRKKSSTK